MHHFREFDTLDPIYAAKRIRISRATAEELCAIYPAVAEAFSHHLASLETCESLRTHHQDNIWSIFNVRGGRLIGMYAMVMLSPEGLVALLDGHFDAYEPRLVHVAAMGAPVAAVYKWGVFAPGIGAAAIPLIAEHLNSPDYRDLDLFGNGATCAGRRIMTSVGFRPVGDPRTPILYKYERLAKRQRFASKRYSSLPIKDDSRRAKNA